MPVSTRPTGTVPIPPILYTSCKGRRSGLSVGLEGGKIASKASIKHLPSTLPSLRSMCHPYKKRNSLKIKYLMRIKIKYIIQLFILLP